MIEIEVKFYAPSLEMVRKRIEERGGIFLGAKKQVDTYFSHPCRDFAHTDEALRLREEEEVVLTYKGRKLDERTKTREEVNVGVRDRGGMENILVSLGFRPASAVRKEREVYSLGDYRVMLDRVEGLGDFVEIEKKGLEYTPQELIDLATQLGLEEERMERRSYMELLEVKDED